MREREYVRRQVAALAAEGKLSAFVLGGLPPLFLIYLLLTKYDYVSVLFSRPLGLADAGRRVPCILGVGRLLDVPTRQGGGLSMTMLFVLGVLLVFAALVLAGSALRNAAPSTGVTRSLELHRGDDHRADASSPRSSTSRSASGC